jgi:hypothetical protein
VQISTCRENNKAFVTLDCSLQKHFLQYWKVRVVFHLQSPLLELQLGAMSSKFFSNITNVTAGPQIKKKLPYSHSQKYLLCEAANKLFPVTML